MTLPSLFNYGVSPQERRHDPAGYENYQSYKPWLRDEYRFRCVYCLFRERWYGTGSDCFSVDHLVPRSVHGGNELDCNYKNLAYSCLHCNSFRGVSSVLNPNEHAFHDHLAVNEQDGRIEGLSTLGVETIRLLRLNDPRFIDRRNRSFLIFSLKDEFPSHLKIHQLYVEEFGFPDDLPDLRTMKPPKANKPNSAASCYFVLRERKKLPETY